MAKNDTAFDSEQDVIKHYKQMVNNEEPIATAEYQEALKDLLKNYEKLLADTKLLTSLGDRLQRKMRQANIMIREQSAEIQTINDDLQNKNVELKLTIDELTRARANRQARVITFFIVYALFIGSESIETVIDKIFPDEFFISLISKSVIFLAVKPLESAVEKYFVKRAMTKDKRDLLDKVNRDRDADDERKAAEFDEEGLPVRKKKRKKPQSVS